MTETIYDVLDRIEVENSQVVDPDLDALKYLQMVYQGQIQAEGPRMRAAIAALPFEVPRLSLNANVESKDFAERLEKAIARSGVRLTIEAPQVHARKVIEAPQPTDVSGPMPGTDRKMRRL
jgi:citrate lyase gamma subunit